MALHTQIMAHVRTHLKVPTGKLQVSDCDRTSGLISLLLNRIDGKIFGDRFYQKRNLGSLVLDEYFTQKLNGGGKLDLMSEMC